MATMSVSGPTGAHGRSSHRLLHAFDSPLRVRVYLLIAISAGVIILAVQWISAGAGEETRQLAAREFQAGSAAAAASLSARIATIQGSILSADSIVASGTDLAGLCEAMSRDPHRAFQRLNVFTIGGDLRCSTVPDARDQPEVIRQRPYFQNALATGDDQVGGPLASAFSGRATLTFAHPVRRAGSLVGVVVAATDVADVVQPVLPVARAERILVVGRDGGRFQIGAQDLPELPGGVNEAIARALTAGESCPVMAGDGTAWTCSPVERTGLVIVAAHPERSVFALVSNQAERQRYRMVGVVLIAIAAAFATDVLFLRRIRVAYGNAGLTGMSLGDTADRDEIDALGEWARTADEAIVGLRQVLDAHEQGRMRSVRDLLRAIAETVEVRYPFLRNHGDRVGQYARQIGIRLGVAGEDLDLLAFAARIHDLGKIAVADAVYLKPSQLEPIEAAQMQLHAIRGGEIAARMRGVPPGVADAILHHHERWDGGGYPDGLAGTSIPLWSRIIAVADAYDAMTEERPYRARPRTHDETIEILRAGAGSQWDATAVYAFIDVVKAGDIQPKPISMSTRRAVSDG